MLEKFLIRHSAPTLAGLKTASLFWYPWEDWEEPGKVLGEWREIFREKGLGIRVMKVNRQRALLYVYRKSRLRADLDRERTREMLKVQGYRYETAEEAVEILRERLLESGEFPHEIGLFLGYPEEDVEGFIENRGKNCKCCGCWKVYCNERDAKRTFCRYKKCEMVYEKLFLQGKPVRRLIVAA